MKDMPRNSMSYHIQFDQSIYPESRLIKPQRFVSTFICSASRLAVFSEHHLQGFVVEPCKLVVNA